MTETQLEKLQQTFKKANLYGGWVAYVAAVGEPDTGDEKLDDLLVELDRIAEKVYLQANKLRIRYGIKD